MTLISGEPKALYMAVTDASDGDRPPDHYEINGIQTLRKEAKAGSGAARAMLPKSWLRDRVKAVRITRGEKEEASPVEETENGRYIVSGYSMQDKEASKVGDGAAIYLPEEWMGEVVEVVRVTKSQDIDGVECPTCNRDDFHSKKGMRKHHAMAHGESIAKTTSECDACGEEFTHFKAENNRRFCSRECSRTAIKNRWGKESREDSDA